MSLANHRDRRITSQSQRIGLQPSPVFFNSLISLVWQKYGFAVIRTSERFRMASNHLVFSGLDFYVFFDPRPTEKIRPSARRMKANNAASDAVEPLTIHTSF